MALSFLKAGKKNAASTVKAELDDEPEVKASTNKTSSKPSSNESKSSSFLKKGKDAKLMMEQEEAKAELRKQEQGKMFRFWVNPGEEHTITFLDGDLDEDGMIDMYVYHEHSVKVNGNFTQFVCTAESEGSCAICDKGESSPAMVGALTICDHTPYKIKKGQNAGKIIVNSDKLFIMKKNTIQQLTKIAVKRGGLRGCTLEVSRATAKDARVGSQFDFVSKMNIKQIMEKYDIDDEDVLKPADYATEIIYHTNEELIEIGVGKAPKGPGYENKSGSKKNLSDEL